MKEPLQSPLRFFVPPDWQQRQQVSYRLPEGAAIVLPFAQPELRRWGHHMEHYLLQQAYNSQRCSVVLITIYAEGYCCLPIECLAFFTALQYTLKGDVFAYLKGGGMLPLFEGTYTIQYVSPGRHQVWVEPGMHHFFYVTFPDDLVALTATDHQHLDKLVQRTRQRSEKGKFLERMPLDTDVSAVISGLQQLQLQGMALELSLHETLTALLRSYYRHLAQRSEGYTSCSAREMATLIRAYIADHLKKNNTTLFANLIRSFNTTERTLERWWTKAYGKPTLKQYIAARRLQRAFCMLSTGQYTIADVADKLHYESFFSFSTLFKKRYGFPPSKVAGMFKP